MKTYLRSSRYLVASLIATIVLGWSASADESMSRVKSALDGVRAQVGGSEERTELWESLLGLKPLAEELEMGADADTSVLRKTIGGLSAAEKPMDEQRLTKLRDAMATWLSNQSEFEAKKKAEKAEKEAEKARKKAEEEAEKAADDKEGEGLQLGAPDEEIDLKDEGEKKNDEEEVEAARKKLEDEDEEDEEEEEEEEGGMTEEGAEDVVDAADSLKDWLRRTGGSTWSRLLPLRAISDAADDPESADPEEVEEMLAQVNAELAHLDRSQFVQLRRALQELLNEVDYPLEEDCALIARRAINQYRGVDSWRLSNARNELQQSTSRLNNFLATGSETKQKGWTAFLKLDDLNDSLKSSGTPVVSTLVKSFNKFNSGEPGLELNSFTDVRDDLEVYLELLQYSETSDGRLAEGRRELQSAVDALDRFLQSSTDEKEKAWKEFLEWETLTAQLEEEIPDSTELRTVADAFDSDEDGLEMSYYRNVSRAIAKLRELVRLNGGKRAEDIYRARVEKLARTLEEHELDPSNDTASELIKELKWIEATGYVPEIASCVRGGFSKPNFFASVSGNFVTKQLNDTITDAVPINRQFEGSQLCGCARTKADVTAQLVPSENGLVIDIQLRGQTVANSTAQQRKVYVRTQGTTDIVASKRLYASLDGLSSEPAVAQTSTFQQTCGVCIDRRCNLGNRLISRIARRKAGESRCKAQRMQSDEAEDTITKRMDDQARELIEKANGQLQDLRARVQSRLQGFAQLRPEGISIRSTSEKIFAQGKITAGRYLGAPSDPPEVGTDSDLTMQIHQSAVNNALASILGGLKLDNDRMIEMMEQNGLSVPEELRAKLATPEPTPAEKDEDADEDADDENEDDEDEDEEVDDESWSITFDTRQPASINFAEGKIRIAIRGRKFAQGAQEVDEPIEISATYRLRKDDQGHLEARMIGDVDIQFVKSTGRLNTRQLAYKTFIKRKTKPLFQRTFSTDDLPEGQLKEQVRSLQIDEIETTRGWLAIAMSLEGLADSFQFTMSQ